MGSTDLFYEAVTVYPGHEDLPSDGEMGKVDGVIEWTPGRQEWAAMVTMAIISLMVALDATILVPALPAIALDIHGSAIDAFWTGTSYLLTSAVFQPFIASLSDIFGRKQMLLVSIFLFTLGTLLCAPVAKDFTVLLAGRSVQGIGGGGVVTLGQVIFADIVPLRQRPKYFAIVLGAWAIGTVAGPLVGGMFVDHLSWRWCFYINFPLCLFGFIAVPLFITLKAETKSSLLSKLRRVDWIGAFFFVGGVTTLLIGLSWAGVQFDWVSVQTLVPIGIGIASINAAVIWECYFAKEPFLTVSLFSSASAIAAFICALCNGLILFCALYYIPLYFMAVRFATPLQSGINLLPISCLLLPGSILVSVLSSRLGRFRWAIWTGWVITAIGCGLFGILDRETPTSVWVVVFCVFGVGSGMVLTSVNVAIQSISPVEFSGRAAAIYAFMRSIGMTVGVAVGGTVFQNVMIRKLGELSLPAAIAHNAEAFIDQLEAMEPSDPVRTGALVAYVYGIHGVFWLMTGVAIFALFSSAIIKKHSMDKALESKFVLKGNSRHRGNSSLSNSSTESLAPRGYSPSGMDRGGLGTYATVSVENHVSGGWNYGQEMSGQPTTSLSEGSHKYPPAEAYYIFQDGARIPAQLPSKSAIVSIPARYLAVHPNEIREITEKERITLILQREA